MTRRMLLSLPFVAAFPRVKAATIESYSVNQLSYAIELHYYPWAARNLGMGSNVSYWYHATNNPKAIKHIQDSIAKKEWFFDGPNVADPERQVKKARYVLTGPSLSGRASGF